jgi:hypothetical protein
MAPRKQQFTYSFRPWSRALLAAGCLTLTAVPGKALAVDIPIGDLTTINITNLFTVGAMVRMQDHDHSLIGKSTLAAMLGNPAPCIARVGGSPSGPNPDGPNSFAGDTCNSTVDDPNFGDANQRFLAQPGALGPNADNGNTNFDKYDVVHAAAKLTTDISFALNAFDTEFNFFFRPLVYFDQRYVNFIETNPDTTLQQGRTAFPSNARERLGSNFEMLDAFVSFSVPFVGDRQLAFRVGNQVLNWGESAFLLPGSLNFINPPNQALLRIPGFDIAELQQPVGMVKFETDITRSLSLEAFYQYDWKPVVLDPVGSFFSQSDILGEGGTYAMLAFAKVPDDPDGLYRPIDNPDDPAALLGSVSSRTVQRNFEEEERRRPSDSGQYGFALKYFFENINNGLEVGFYYANYHSRFPLVSTFAADASCLSNQPGPINATVIGIGNFLEAITGIETPISTLGSIGMLLEECEVPLVNNILGDAEQAGFEPLPLDSAQLFVEYPEDLQLFGLSFNTALGPWAFSGEYVFRDRLPTQIHTTDLIYASLQPAFPAEDVSLAPIATLPGRRTAVPDFISQYRGIEIEANQYIRGYENLKTGQLNLNFIRFVGGSNPIGASQITLLLETGLTHVIDFPDLSELQFNGGQADTHISHGADGSVGIQPRDVANVAPGNPNDPDNFARRGRQNPTAQADRRAFGTQYSYGYRAVALSRYDNALFGANLELLTAFFHDVRGTTPGIGGNFVEGRRQYIAGVGFDYLNSLNGQLRYTWFTGGGQRDLLRDRDNLMLFLGYRF